MDLFNDFTTIKNNRPNQSPHFFNIPNSPAPFTKQNSNIFKRPSSDSLSSGCNSPKIFKDSGLSRSVHNNRPNETVTNSPFYPTTPSYRSSCENPFLFSSKDITSSVSLSKTLHSPLIAINDTPVSLFNSNNHKYNLPTPVIKVSTSPVKDMSKGVILESKEITLNKTSVNSEDKIVKAICLKAKSKAPTEIKDSSSQPQPIVVKSKDSSSQPQTIVVKSKDSSSQPQHIVVKTLPKLNTSSNVNTIIIKAVPKSVKKSQHPYLPTIKEDLSSRKENILPENDLFYYEKTEISNAISKDYENSDEVEYQQNEAYSNYEPSKFKGGKPHPYVVVESRSLMSIEPPDITYKLKMPNIIIKNGILSKVQLEAVVYACQKHEEFYDGVRYGFLIGDGAGVGKGRTVGGILFENYLAGRKKAIWISVSNDLKQDAERDLGDIGGPINTHIKVVSINKMNYNKIDSEENGSFSEGVLFVTYSSLVSKSKHSDSNLFSKRLHQIIDWVGLDFDGVIVFDECHKAKNLQQRSKTKTASNVKKLQDKLTKARIVYASATGASEPKHMAYMVRLGLWGPGKYFSEFSEFESTLTSFGVGAMELIAIEMKKRGVYLARQLSFKDVKFEIREMEVEKSTINGHRFTDAYNSCVEVWSNIYREFTSAFERNKYEEKDQVNFEAQFWSAHQRFFKYLCIAGKIEKCVQIAKDEVENNKCVVIGLQSTGEARTNDLMEDSPGDLVDFVSSAKGVVKSLIENHYPSLKTIERNKVKKQIKMTKGHSTLRNTPILKYSSFDSEKSFVSKCSSSDLSNLNEFTSPAFTLDTDGERRMMELVEKIDSMLPLNALDHLIRDLGGPNKVAEMTGRKGRMIEEEGKISYHSRKELEYGLDQINILEKDRFNNGKKQFAIISDAASTGISLHSDKRFKNTNQRFHITLELPWSADKAIQQFGRTHRSNQVNSPHYVFLISNLAGERRFAATVAKRLESLGALTHGDRRCVDSRDLSQFNLDNEFGAKAVQSLMQTILFSESPLIPFPEKFMLLYDNNERKFLKEACESLSSVGIIKTKAITVTKFLNRILGIKLDMQNALFQYFLDLIEYESQKAKSRNEFDHGIRDVVNDNDNLYVVESMTFQTNSGFDNDEIIVNQIQNRNGISWESAFEKYKKNKRKNGFYSFQKTKDNQVNLLAYIENKGDEKYVIMKPNYAAKEIDKKTLKNSWTKISPKSIEKEWEKLYIESKDKCVHQIDNQRCPQRDCTLGKRTKTNYIITGAVLLAMKKIYSANINKKLEIVRIELADKQKLIGALIPNAYYKVIISALKDKYNAPKIQKFLSDSFDDIQIIGQDNNNTNNSKSSESIVHKTKKRGLKRNEQKSSIDYQKVNEYFQSQCARPIKSENTQKILPKIKKEVKIQTVIQTKEFKDVIIKCIQRDTYPDSKNKIV